MGILSFIGGIFKPATELIDSLHTSEEERKQLHNELAKIQGDFQAKVLEYEEKVIDFEKQLVSARSDILKAEIEGKSWLQRNWRPILMLVVILIIANNYILFPYLGLWTEKVQMLPLPNGLFALLTAGVGGYVVGRSGEKVAEKFRRLPGDKPKER
jgi:hypothetical protein